MASALNERELESWKHIFIWIGLLGVVLGWSWDSFHKVPGYSVKSCKESVPMGIHITTKPYQNRSQERPQKIQS
eukprot:2103337-Amphidinium_carterae.1